MGFFSWKCAKSEESIVNAHHSSGPTPCVVVCPDDTLIHDYAYEGYGQFNFRDIYELLARWNGYNEDNTSQELRLVGIELDSGEIGPAPGVTGFLPIKIVKLEHYDGESYEELPASKNCPYQGFFMPDSPEDLDAEDSLAFRP